MDNEIHILFVDDIWCKPEKQSIILADFGALQRRDIPYVFHYETAETAAGGYGIEPVLQRISGIPGLAAVILDIMFGEEGDRLGLGILAAIRDRYPTLPVFIMTSLEKQNIEVVERAMELGANEYLVKKPTLEELETVLRIYAQPSSFEADYAIWGNSPSIRQIRSTIARVAVGGTASVLITGESGTGKELVARAVHRQGPRRRGPFVDKNCAHEKSDLLDSDLFGHEKGAFTGADRQHIGRLERADGGVLFLDEIGSMQPELQAKLLRVLETRCFQRLGGVEDVSSDFQLICATNGEPAEMVRKGKLREDLFFRVRQIEISLPPLRERRQDIPILAELFLRRFKTGPGASYQATRINKNAMEAVSNYSWPGNVRELKNVIERAAILCRSKEIGRNDLPIEVLRKNQVTDSSGGGTSGDLPDDKSQWARHFVSLQLRTIARALEETDGNATMAVKHLFPLINSPNATYLKRYVKRLMEAPWGCDGDAELAELADRILASLGRKGR